jgi:hypothetical protein
MLSITLFFLQFGIGGPLVDSEGHFVGMNMSHMDTEGTLFLPKERILESFVPCEIPRYVCYNFIFYLFKRGWGQDY